MSKMLENCKSISFSDMEDWYVSPMPALEVDKNKIAWILADHIAKKLDLPLINATLDCTKPLMKQFYVEDKILIWNNIYHAKKVDINENIQGKNILIIDDLYQSGIMICSYA